MEIQISVIVWTVICFLGLMLILKYLLFEPVLKVMDQRNERIALAKRRYAEHCEQEKEAADKSKREVEQLLSSAAAKNGEALERAKKEAEEKIALANEKRQAELSGYSEKLSLQRKSIAEGLGKNTESLAQLFAEGFCNKI